MQPWSPFNESAPPDVTAKALRLSCLHLAAHVLDDGPPQPTEEMSTASGIAIVKSRTPEERVGDVVAGAGKLMEFIEKAGSVSPDRVALEEISALLASGVVLADPAHAESVQRLMGSVDAIVRGALGSRG